MTHPLPHHRMLITNSDRTLKLYTTFACLTAAYLGFATGAYLIEKGMRSLLVLLMFFVVSLAYSLARYIDAHNLH